jgi:cell division protein FtsL
MPSPHKETDGIPLIVFIPVIVCIVAILILLDFRQRQNHPQQYRKHTQREDAIVEWYD